MNSPTPLTYEEFEQRWYDLSLASDWESVDALKAQYPEHVQREKAERTPMHVPNPEVAA